MHFTDRTEAGKLLAQVLKDYKGKDVVVYALPRGGVVTALEIARYLHSPLDLIITRKIGHPTQPEYAIAAVAENGHVVGSEKELRSVDELWLSEEIKRQREEAKRRREKYLQKRAEVSVQNKVAILVDDGVATGLTIRAGIVELRHRKPKKIIVAVPVVPQTTAEVLKKEADELVALDTPSDYEFLGSVGAYYDEFYPVEDEEVIALLKAHDKRMQQGVTVSSSHLQAAVDPTLFAFPHYDAMASQLQEVPHLTLGTFSLKQFPNHELHIKLKTHAAQRECIVLGTISPPEANLVTFLLLCHTLRKENAYRITALLPYLAYSRHDKKEPLESYATNLIGKLFHAAGVDEVITVDVHSPRSTRLFPIPLISLSPAVIFAEEIKKLELGTVTIVAPDTGAKRRCELVAKALGNKRVAVMVKERSKKGITHLSLRGKVGEKVVIVDDILDTGQTLISACELLREKGVKEIVIMVTHGLFTGKEWKKLWKLGVKRIYCTDTVQARIKVPAKKITIISIVPLFINYLSGEYSTAFAVEKKRISNDIYDYL